MKDQEKNLFTQRFQHPLTGEEGVFVRFEDNRKIYKTSTGIEFTTDSADGTWIKGRWDREYVSYRPGETTCRLTDKEFEEVEVLRQRLQEETQATWNQYKNEFEKLRGAAEEALYQVILPWEQHLIYGCRLGNELEKWYKQKFFPDGYSFISHPVRHWFPHRLPSVSFYSNVCGEPPLANVALNIYGARKRGNIPVAEIFEAQTIAREMWDARIHIVRNKDFGLWKLQFYREPVDKSGWAAGFGGGYPTWREWRKSFSEQLLVTVHPHVFISFAEQIKSGVLESYTGPLETMLRNQIMNKNQRRT